MSKRLNQEREQKLQPLRIEHAKQAIEALGYSITSDHTTITFTFKGNLIHFFPYSGWHSGKGIKDGRGLSKLLKQIQP